MVFAPLLESVLSFLLVIDLLEALSVPRSVRGVTKAKGREPEAQAWRFRSRTTHLTLPRDFSVYLLSSSQGSLGLHLVGQQTKNSEATLISLSSEAALQLDGLPLLRLSSSTRDNWLRLEYRSQNGLKPEVLTLPGGNPFTSGDWVRFGLSLEPKKLLLFVECTETTVLELDQDQTLNLELPLDLQVTFSSTAGNKTSKFSGYWQTAELSTKAYERRPWICFIPVCLQHEQLQARVQYLESCECVRRTCTWESRVMEEGSRWEVDRNTMCSCTSGKVQCTASNDCTYNGRMFSNNDIFRPTPCTTCVCKVRAHSSFYLHRFYLIHFMNLFNLGFHGSRSLSFFLTYLPCSYTPPLSYNGRMNCEDEHCPPLSCSRKYLPQGACCHVCQPGCEYEGGAYADGEEFVSRTNPCLRCTCFVSLFSDYFVCVCVCVCVCAFVEYTVCACLKCVQNGNVECSSQSCPLQDCTLVETVGGECCPRCRSKCVPESSEMQVTLICAPAMCAGCEYEGRRYSDGEVFQPPGDGPCLRCSCEGGNIRCHKERCPAVRCSNPVRDPHTCCPVCKGCVSDGKEYDEGARWTSKTDPCMTCSCVSGEVICAISGCASPNCHHPNIEPGACCPTCNHCLYKQRVYENGQRFPDPDRPCQGCTCQDGTVRCGEDRQPECPSVTCSNPQTPSGQCCAQCPGCLFDNRVFTDGETFPNPTNPCEQCVCTGGSVNCQQQCSRPICQNPVQGTCCQNNCNGTQQFRKVNKQAELPNTSPLLNPQQHSYNIQCIYLLTDKTRTRCPSLHCADPILSPGQCCPQCPAPPADCVYEVRSYRHTQQFHHPHDNCQSCSCTNGTVSCHHRPCPFAPCSHPILQECCRTCDGCMYDRVEYANGAVFADKSDPCGTCVCREGTVTCERRRCPANDCPFPVPGQCCQSCEGCRYAGVEYANNQEFPNPADRCNHCVCTNGHVTCSRKPCYNSGCSHPVTLPGQCCPVCDDCLFQGVVHTDGETFPGPNSACEECRCSRGEVRCQTKSCPRVQCSYPIVDLCGCEVCDGCSFHGRVYDNGARFPDPQDHCKHCVCMNGGVSCASVDCPGAPCRRPVRRPGECCPVCTGTCEHSGQVYESGSTFTPANDPCSSCTCLNGRVSCKAWLCSEHCTHPIQSTDCCPVCDACLYEGLRYTDRQTFVSQSDPCQQCLCLRGSVTCTRTVCPEVSCPSPAGKVQCAASLCLPLNCMHQITDPQSCCPRCRGCVYDGVEHAEGSTWFASSSPCMSCMCVDGVTTCSEIQCLSPCINKISVPGECCPLCADCTYEGHVYGPGENFHPSNDPCQICTCEVMPDGQQHLRCYRKQCPSLVDCPKHNIQFSGPDSCCPVCAQPLSNCTATLIGNEVLATDDPCFTCQCKDLTWTCIHQSCSPLSCPPDEHYTPPDSCCPVCDVCVVEGERGRVSNGESWTDSEDECITCSCNMGHIDCNIEVCAPLICQEGLVKVKSPGKCCYECQDPSVQCVYEGQKYDSNEHWEVDQCTSCTCVSGDVHCQTERCPALSCAADETPSLIPGMCCPHCIPRPATCIVFGDPHYRTFDGKMVNFQGACSYVLAQDCEGGDFSIHVMNDDRGRKGVSWTKEVTVFIGDVVVQLLQDWIVKVDYEVVSLPFLKEPYVYLERKTNTILLNTNIGVKVLWNGRSHLEVSVPGTYKKHVCGICGNFNNYPQDDMRLRNGQISNSEAEFGNDWKVGSGSHSSGQCSDGRNIDPCKEAGYSARKTANSRCAVLKSAVFERCHKVVPPEMFFASCVYDLCACSANSDECLCEALEAYASECREAGVILQWRSPSLCAVGCPLDRGYVFDECGPPCPKTCFNKDVPLGVIEAHCFKPCVPGCQCPAGLVEHDAHCIAPEKCPKIIYGNS
uniref:Si:dkey-266m15.6 n=1 Tax=Astyanax mexicanus TaxID=7994 RepID=A0A8B9HBU1_ASTMX